jgi:hypothetical protein
MTRFTLSLGRGFIRESKEAAEQSSHILQNRIAWVMARPEPAAVYSPLTLESRRAKRFAPLHPLISLTLNNGEKREARIVNVSRFGVLVDADFADINASDVIAVGSTNVKHVRHVKGGAAFMFTKPLSARAFDPNLML